MKKVFTKALGPVSAVCMLAILASNVFASVDGNSARKIDEELFPDANFRQYVSSKIDKDSDGYLTVDEALAVTAINVDNKSIGSLEGIKYFKNLKSISCNFNSIRELEVSSLPKLNSLSCIKNGMRVLSVTDCPALSTITCCFNDLSTLSLDNFKKLKTVICYSNPNLEFISVIGDSNLTSLNCSNCGLKELRFFGCHKLKTLYCQNNILDELLVLDASLMENAVNGTAKLMGNGTITYNSRIGAGYIMADADMLIIKEDLIDLM